MQKCEIADMIPRTWGPSVPKRCLSPARVVILVLALAVCAQARAALFLHFPTDSVHSNAVIAAAIANVPRTIGTVYDASGRTDDIQVWNYSTLVYTGPFDVSSTLERIRHDQWMGDHYNDGGFFNFYPNELPNIPRLGNNYYMEFIVWPAIDVTAGTYDEAAHPYDPGVNWPGPMRILLGRGGEVWFTGDHYGDGPLHLPAYPVNTVTAPEPAGAGAFLLALLTASGMIRRRGSRHVAAHRHDPSGSGILRDD